MKSKRLLCALFALMLVGAGVTNTVAVFADESAETEGGISEVINTNEGQGEGAVLVEGAGEAEGANVVEEGPVEEEEEEEAVVPAGSVSGTPVLKAAPAAAGEPTRAGDDVVLLGAEPTMESYDYEMALSDRSKTLQNVTDITWYDYRCSVAPASGSGGMGCNVRDDGRVIVNASRAGE